MADFGPFQVPAGPGSMTVEPKLARGVTLRGRVTGAADAAGLRVVADRVSARPIESTVRADLTFELAGLGPGRTSVSVTDRAGWTRSMRVEVGTVDLDVELPLRAGTGSIRATVQGSRTGVVNVVREDAAPGQLRFLALQFRDGAFTIDGLARGRYRVAVQSLQGGPESSTEVDVGDGEVALTVECREPR